jgi:hypothetical protein
MSVSVKAGLQILSQLLERRKDRIKQATRVLKVTFHPVQDSHFSVQVWWQGGGTLIKRFDYDDVYTQGPHGPRPKYTACQLSKQLIQDILQARGI